MKDDEVVLRSRPLNNAKNLQGLINRHWSVTKLYLNFFFFFEKVWNAVKAWTRVMAKAEAVYIKLNKKTKHLRLCHGTGVDLQTCTAASTSCKQPQVMATPRCSPKGTRASSISAAQDRGLSALQNSWTHLVYSVHMNLAHSALSHTSSPSRVMGKWALKELFRVLQAEKNYQFL